MALINKTFYKYEELKEHIKTHKPSFYFSSQTSTVIPYDHLKEVFKQDDFYLCDLSHLPKSMTILANGNLLVKGPVSWRDAKEFLSEHKKAIKTSPTEELALITAGAATSATGERYFGFGNLRSQIHNIKYLNYKGEEITLTKNKKINFNTLKAYQKESLRYQNFKNAPYPTFENEVDLLIGTEGQLGVITEVELEITDNVQVNHLFMLLPKWEDDYSIHMEISKKIQKFRDTSHVCEFIDSNSFNFLKKEERPNKGKDAIFFEVRSDKFEDFYENFIMTIKGIDENEIFEVSNKKFHEIRASIPRAVFEENSKMGVKKMGTDVQVRNEDFSKLFDIYRKFSHTEVVYNLFGHFGDAHLHFNFMPTPDQTQKCNELFQNMYKEVKDLSGSPFAEHGIGIIKQKFIKDYWSENQKNTFKELKSIHDPYNQFFPQGFMCLE